MSEGLVLVHVGLFQSLNVLGLLHPETEALGGPPRSPLLAISSGTWPRHSWGLSGRTAQCSVIGAVPGHLLHLLLLSPCLLQVLLGPVYWAVAGGLPFGLPLVGRHAGRDHLKPEVGITMSHLFPASILVGGGSVISGAYPVKFLPPGGDGLTITSFSHIKVMKTSQALYKKKPPEMFKINSKMLDHI